LSTKSEAIVRDVLSGRNIDATGIGERASS